MRIVEPNLLHCEEHQHLKQDGVELRQGRRRAAPTEPEQPLGQEAIRQADHGVVEEGSLEGSFEFV